MKANATRVDIFVNLHPIELLDESLLSGDGALSTFAPRVVLEITERASLSGIGDLRERTRRLRQMGFRLAVDDLGAGYAGLSSFASLEPEVVKIDMSLVRDVGLSATKQRLIASMASACKDLGITVLAEGVETTEERDAVVLAGCDQLQGYLFARPQPPFRSVLL
jgi:EAL domain-containing protein (putative c-di-GMP-specific phosphodiesterase class I)